MTAARGAAVACLAALVAVSACADARLVEVRSPAGDVSVSVRVEFADTAEERRRGLVGAEPLRPGQGLWLRFPTTGEVCLTNEGVSFPIDAIFADAVGGVVAIEREIPAGDPSLRCHGATASVLEVYAGVAVGASVGDVLHGPL